MGELVEINCHYTGQACLLLALVDHLFAVNRNRFYRIFSKSLRQVSSKYLCFLQTGFSHQNCHNHRLCKPDRANPLFPCGYTVEIGRPKNGKILAVKVPPNKTASPQRTLYELFFSERFCWRDHLLEKRLHIAPGGVFGRDWAICNRKVVYSGMNCRIIVPVPDPLGDTVDICCAPVVAG